MLMQQIWVWGLATDVVWGGYGIASGWGQERALFWLENLKSEIWIIAVSSLLIATTKVLFNR